MISPVSVGLLADTHIPRRLKQLPDAALEALKGVDLILHAGDVDDPAALKPLQALAPVYAVRGNLHIADLSDGGASLPAVVELELAGRKVVLTHGYRPGWRSLALKVVNVAAQWLGWMDNGDLNRHIVAWLAQAYPEADIIVFGHSHRAHIERIGQTLLVNPGAVCPTRKEQASVARMQLGAGEPQVEIVPLLTAFQTRLY